MFSNTMAANDDHLNSLSREELINKIKQQEAHVKQLKNIISKSQHDGKKAQKKGQRPFDFNKYNTRHVALKIIYLGWDYHGFAVQEDTDKTIEAALFEALIKTRLIESRETSCYHRCGRTDKGVSAFSQVISIDLRTNLLNGLGVKERLGGTASTRPSDKDTEIQYVHILNKVLPPEIRVTAWCPVDPEFSARFSCLKRTYKYFFPRGDLDLEVMRKGAQKLIGEHDFRNLCKMDVGGGVVNYMRKILETNIQVLDDSCGGYEMVELTVVGQAFLWHQIRCIVAVLVLIGQHKEDPQVIDTLLDVKNNPRRPQYSMASELPLVLYDCEFEGVSWIYEPGWHKDTIRHVQDLWAKQSVRATMLRRMLKDLSAVSTTEGDDAIQNQAEFLSPGNKSRVYKPLMERELCDSLEERIESFAKRRKISKPNGDTSCTANQTHEESEEPS